MTLKSFFHFVELRTKAASVMPLFFGVLYSYWAYRQFSAVNTLLMLASLLCIDMATTASNNYMDFRRAVHREGYNYEHHNTLVRDGIHLKTALGVIGALLTLGVVFGLLLVLRTDWIVLMIGVISFGMGLLYSWGPWPVSHGPFGEGISGFFMGFIIVFLTVYIQLPEPYWIMVTLRDGILSLNLRIVELMRLFGVSVPLVCGIANIMLSNNLSDLEEDRLNGRKTLPVLIGPLWSRRFSKGLYLAAYAGLGFSLLMRWVPASCAVVFLTLPYVVRGAGRFYANPTKADTFVLSVKSFLAISGMYCLGMIIGVSLL